MADKSDEGAAGEDDEPRRRSEVPDDTDADTESGDRSSDRSETDSSDDAADESSDTDDPAETVNGTGSVDSADTDDSNNTNNSDDTADSDDPQATDGDETAESDDTAGPADAPADESAAPDTASETDETLGDSTGSDDQPDADGGDEPTDAESEDGSNENRSARGRGRGVANRRMSRPGTSSESELDDGDDGGGAESEGGDGNGSGESGDDEFESPSEDEHPGDEPDEEPRAGRDREAARQPRGSAHAMPQSRSQSSDTDSDDTDSDDAVSDDADTADTDTADIDEAMATPEAQADGEGYVGEHPDPHRREQEYPDPDEDVGGISQPPDDEEMPLADHIEEMVLRLAKVLLVGAAATAIGLLWASDAIGIIWADIFPGEEVPPPHIYNPLELWLTRIKVAALAGILAALPWFVYETYLFMRPGLYPHERKYYLASVPLSIVLALLGMLFSYFLVLPVLFLYFTYYSEGSALIAYGLADTFNLILTLMGFLAVVFQIPLFIMLAIMMGVTTRQWLAEKRLYFWAGFAGLAFMFTIDPTMMAPVLVAITMILLFEGTLALLKWTGRE